MRTQTLVEHTEHLNEARDDGFDVVNFLTGAVLLVLVGLFSAVLTSAVLRSAAGEQAGAQCEVVAGH